MHPYLFNAAQEKLLIYRIQMKQYDVINFNDTPYFAHVWAPHLAEFLQYNLADIRGCNQLRDSQSV
jgi:hypothetical protein